VAKDEACIIAINSREIPHAWADAKEFLYRTSLRSGKPVPPHRCIVASRPLVVSIGRYWVALTEQQKRSRHRSIRNRADVCGILGSSANVWNVPSPLGDDFKLMPSAHLSRAGLRRSPWSTRASGSKASGRSPAENSAFASTGTAPPSYSEMTMIRPQQPGIALEMLRVYGVGKRSITRRVFSSDSRFSQSANHRTRSRAGMGLAMK
jgi:hypothetical protein